MSLGVIGGMGPMATAYLFELIVKMTKADCDADHLEVIIYNVPSVPDRTKYILGESQDSPLPKMLEVGHLLEEQQVQCIAIPCMTAHYFHEELSQLKVPIIHGIRKTAQTLKEAGITKAGIMATDGTIRSGIFQREIESFGMEAVLPNEENQRKIMGMIYDDVKAGRMPELEDFQKVKDHFIKEKGAQAVVLGCTELSLLKKTYDLGRGVIDSLEVLAKEAVLSCNKEVNPEFAVLCVPYDNVKIDTCQ